jgi:hypothetical protein
MSEPSPGVSKDHTNLSRPGKHPDEIDRSVGISDGHINLFKPTKSSEETQNKKVDKEIDFSERSGKNDTSHHVQKSHICCGAPGT